MAQQLERRVLPTPVPPHAAAYSSPPPNFLGLGGDLTFSSPPRTPKPVSPGPPGQPPQLALPRPTVQSLTDSVPADPVRKVAWARDVLALVDRTAAAGAITDPALTRLVDAAIHAILAAAAEYAPAAPAPPPHVAEALYLRGTLASSGSFPTYVAPSPRNAFRDFEAAARAKHHAAWFKIGRDYETVGDVARARECFERGVRLAVPACCYRMGMAHLLGQLGLVPGPSAALPLLQRAAALATPDVPQPPYVLALILLGEFDARVPSSLLGPSPHADARRHLERAAYLGYAPAQFRLGHAHEFAEPPFAFDPLLSVQYYSLAAQQGEPEADMALSKWFLCGAEGAFDKDEALARTFADKAARAGLASGEFAMGYYAEVGIGAPKDLADARRWYERAAAQGNADAAKRLEALSAGSGAEREGRARHGLCKHRVHSLRNRPVCGHASAAQTVLNDFH